MEADDLKKDSNLRKTEVDPAKKKKLKKEIGGQDGPEPNRLDGREKKVMTTDMEMTYSFDYQLDHLQPKDQLVLMYHQDCYNRSQQSFLKFCA